MIDALVLTQPTRISNTTFDVLKEVTLFQGCSDEKIMVKAASAFFIHYSANLVDVGGSMGLWVTQTPYWFKKA